MNRLKKILLYLGTIVVVMQGWIILAGFLALGFSFLASPLWFIPAAVLIDGYFGTWHSIPLITVYATIFAILVEFIRPYMIWHNEGVE